MTVLYRFLAPCFFITFSAPEPHDQNQVESHRQAKEDEYGTESYSQENPAMSVNYDATEHLHDQKEI